MNEDMVEAVFDWISEMRAGNLRFIIGVPNISLPHLEAWSHIKASQQKVWHLIQVHNLLILSKLGIHCGKPSVYLILDFLLEVSIKSYSI